MKRASIADPNDDTTVHPRAFSWHLGIHWPVMVNNSSAVDFIPRERFRDRVEEDICSGLSDWDEQRSKGFIGRELSLLLVVAISRRHVHFSFYAKDFDFWFSNGVQEGMHPTLFLPPSACLKLCHKWRYHIASILGGQQMLRLYTFQGNDVEQADHDEWKR